MNQDNEVLVRVNGVSKKFCRDLKKSLWFGVKDIASELLPIKNSKSPASSLREGEFWAVKDVSFELRRGECIGLIGRNGAGKTTLLKMLNGLIKPDEGTIEMRGKVGALIALGAGFNPILTGRENIYVNGSILGLTKEEIDSKIDSIIEFAEIPEFIDSPVQSYSSGMQVRLGFAVATALYPDVLILDEVLAVGDASFRAKCYQRVVELRKNAAVIFVSHSMEQVGRICDRVLLMSKSRCVFNGDVGEGIHQYESLNEQGEEIDKSFLSIGKDIRSFQLEIINPEIITGSPLHFKMTINSGIDISDCILRFVFYNVTGAIVADCNEKLAQVVKYEEINKGIYELSIKSIPLKYGKYYVGFGLIDCHGDLIVWSYKQNQFAVNKKMNNGIAECQLDLISTYNHI